MRIGEYARREVEDRDRAPRDHSAEHSPSSGAAAATALRTDDSHQAEIMVLLALGIGKPTIARAAMAARRNGTSLERELIANGWIDAESYYGGLARALRIPFLPAIDASLINDDRKLDTQLIDARTARLHDPGRAIIAIVPEARRLAALARMLADRPGLIDRTAVTTPSALRAAIWEAGAERRVRESISTLFENTGRFSARIVLSGTQGVVAGAGLCAFGFAVASGAVPIVLLHAALSLVYMAALLLRACALGHRRGEAASPQPCEVLPIYSVLVALYKEAEVASQLVAALKQLNWPASKLDIKLVCEADDHTTIAALQAADLAPQFEIVRVPVAHPRTKPKALNYALAAVRGEFVVIYDAEDRPHPDQLRAAHAQFVSSAGDVVCIQAPLVISNGRDSWISAAFALEYAALFRMLLPMLAKRRLPLPLGGTSNHLRVAELRACGGWDPYNVTEDADLGMRLYRLGYRCGVIDCPTHEDAPTTFNIWLNQRTRWFKGWLQTWLVMMRSPRTLMMEMGVGAFLVFQLLIGGMLIASLAHPWLIVLLLSTATYLMLGFPPPGTREALLFLIDMANMLASYGLFLLLGKKAMHRDERRSVGWRWIAVPLYWLMISIAAWRAVFQLPFKPFFWDKTPHLPADSAGKLHPPRGIHPQDESLKLFRDKWQVFKPYRSGIRFALSNIDSIRRRRRRSTSPNA